MTPRKIRALMVEKDVSQIEIAIALEVSPVTVNGVIHGRWSSRRIANELASKLGVPVEKLFKQYAA